MEKTELMIEYEIKIDSVVNWEANPIGYAKYLESELIKERAKPTITYQAVETFQEIIRNQCDEITALKEKAEAYDRLMSGALSMKELANILKHPVAIDNDEGQNTLYYFGSIPHLGQFSDGTQFWSCKRKWRLPRQLVHFTGDWKDSLTMPDGLEERMNQEETFDYNLEQLGLK